MTGVAIPCFIYVMMKSKYKWVKFMFFLCILQDIDTIALSIVDFSSVSDGVLSDPKLRASFLGFTIFLFYFTENLMYWLFGLKYWVISIEVPCFLEQKLDDDTQVNKRFCTE